MERNMKKKDEKEGSAANLKGILGNLKLAHDIALSKDGIKEENFSSKEIAALWKTVKKQVHNIYWDNLRKDLSSQPPKLDNALELVEDIKEKLYAVMTANVKSARLEVEKELDKRIIETEVRQGNFDLEKHARFLLRIMSQICAPIRDFDIKKVSREVDPIKLLRGVVEILDKMKVDMLNYAVKTIKPSIEANNFDYERRRFSDYVQIAGTGLKVTTEWIKPHIRPELSNEEIVQEAFVECLEWGPRAYPETLILDVPHLQQLQKDFEELTLISSILLASFAYLPAALSINKGFYDSLKANLRAILRSSNTTTNEKGVMANIVAQIIVESNSYLRTSNQPELDSQSISGISIDVPATASREHRIRRLVIAKGKEYCVKRLKEGAQASLPSTLGLISEEMIILGQKLNHIFNHNMNICIPHYRSIINKNA